MECEKEKLIKEKMLQPSISVATSTTATTTHTICTVVVSIVETQLTGKYSVE